MVIEGRRVRMKERSGSDLAEEAVSWRAADSLALDEGSC